MNVTDFLAEFLSWHKNGICPLPSLYYSKTILLRTTNQCLIFFNYLTLIIHNTVKASSAVRIEEEEPDEEDEDQEGEKDEENPEESNSFYSSYNEAMQGDDKVFIS